MATLVRLTERYCVVLQTLKSAPDDVGERARTERCPGSAAFAPGRAGSTSASPTPAPRRCTSSPRSTACRRCAPCSPCSRGSPPAPPTATRGWPERPAATLLHLGPGLGNGLANLHNARRAGTPVVNVVGDHATTHAKYDAPLQSDIAAIAGAVSGWVRATRARRRGRRRRRGGGGRGLGRAGRDAGAAGRRQLGPGRRHRRGPRAGAVARGAAPRGRPGRAPRGGRRVRLRRAVRAAGRRRRDPGRGPRRRRPDRRRHRGTAARRDVPDPARARRRRRARRPAGLPRRHGRPASSRGARAPRAGRGPLAGVVLRATPTATATWYPPAAACTRSCRRTASRAAATAALEELADLLAPGTAAAARPPRPVPSCPPGR